MLLLVQKRQSTSPNYLRRLEAADIGSLRTFCTVVETGSFTAASRVLNIAPSTVSKHIDALEHALERPLIQRTTRRFSITDDGRAFYNKCQIALNALSEVVDRKQLKAASPTISGRLRVTAPPALSHTVIGPRLGEFVRRFPNITLEYLVTAASRDLVAEGVDIAIRIDDQPSAKYPAISIGEDRRVFCASPAFIASNGSPSTPEDLSKFNCLVNVYTVHQQTWPMRVGNETKAVPISGTVACNNGDILRDLCLDGIGIGLFSFLHIQQELSMGTLVELLHDYQAPKRSIFALVPHKKYVSDCTTVFLDFVREILTHDKH